MRPYRRLVPSGSGCAFHSIENLDSHPGMSVSYSVVCVSGLLTDAQAETAAASRPSLIQVTIVRGRSLMGSQRATWTVAGQFAAWIRCRQRVREISAWHRGHLMERP